MSEKDKLVQVRVPPAGGRYLSCDFVGTNLVASSSAKNQREKSNVIYSTKKWLFIIINVHPNFVRVYKLTVSIHSEVFTYVHIYIYMTSSYTDTLRVCKTASNVLL